MKRALPLFLALLLLLSACTDDGKPADTTAAESDSPSGVTTKAQTDEPMGLETDENGGVKLPAIPI